MHNPLTCNLLKIHPSTYIVNTVCGQYIDHIFITNDFAEQLLSGFLFSLVVFHQILVAAMYTQVINIFFFTFDSNKKLNAILQKVEVH